MGNQDEEICMNINKAIVATLLLSILIGAGCSSDRDRTSAPDTTPPAAVSTLTLTGRTSSAITLGWVAPGDDGESGTASSYTIRYSTQSITNDNWHSATAIASPPMPEVAGTQQSVTISSLASATYYYMALKAADEATNWSNLSNVASGSTSGDPELTVSPDTLDFGGALSELTFTIANSGTGSMNWAVSENVNWLTVDEESGSASTETDTITVTVDRTNLTAGDHEGTIAVDIAGEISYQLVILISVAETPILVAHDETLIFGTDLSDITFTLSNGGSGTLTWTAAGDQSWFTLNPASGTTTTETDSIKVTVDRTGLNPGDYTGEITITPDVGDAATLGLTMTVPEPPDDPILSVSTETLDFSDTLTSLTLGITNSGTGTLSWTVTDNQSWLTVDPTSGTTTTESDVIAATVDRSGLTPGGYTGTVTISAGGKTAQEVAVQMTVPEPPEEPVLAFTPDTLDFGSAENMLTFIISNAGTGTLSWTAAEDLTWLSLTPASGTSTSENDTVSVTIDRDGLDPGDYTGTITISPEGEASEELAVSMNVPEEPQLAYAPGTLNFGSDTTELTFTITNIGTGTLSWTVADNQSWMIVSPASGTTTTEGDVVTVTIDRTGLDPDDYSGTVTITPEGGAAQNLPVAMTVPEEPVMAIEPDELEFGTDLVELTFTIINEGTGTLEWNITESTSWIGVTPRSGTTTTEEDVVTVTVSRAGVDPEDYEATITVGAVGSAAQEVTVRMSVTAAPVMAVSETYIEYSDVYDALAFTITNTGTGTFSWVVTGDVVWLGLDPASGDTSSEADVITVTVDRSGLPPGRYWGNVTVTPDVGAAAIIEISISVLGFPTGEMILLSADTFEMGSPDTEPSRQNDEDQHWVQLSRNFYMSETEVTNQQYIDALNWAVENGKVTSSTTIVRDNLDGSTEDLFEISDDGHIVKQGNYFALRNPAFADLAVIDVTWFGAARYCDWLSMQESPALPRAYDHDGDWACNSGNPYTASGYRLPTESEWEYACRAGSDTPFNTGDCLDSITEANYNGYASPYPGCSIGDDREGAIEIGTFPPNAFGLYDMHGNVAEYCNDWSGSYPNGTEGAPDIEPSGPATGSVRVVRGGHYDNTAAGCRTAARDGDAPGTNGPRTGFRPVRSAW
jgi:formylglycine-generating enzyme required for sulfatase activity